MLPITETLTGRRSVAGGDRNPHGYVPVGGWEDYPIPIHGRAPGASQESVSAGRDQSLVAWTLYCPAGVQVQASDRVVVDGVEFEAVGDSLDWSHGPWGHPTAGVVVELKRQEG